MSTIGRLLCCCLKQKPLERPLMEEAQHQDIYSPPSSETILISERAQQASSSDSPQSSRSGTPDSAYGGGSTHQGTITGTTPVKFSYGAVSTERLV